MKLQSKIVIIIIAIVFVSITTYGISLIQSNSQDTVKSYQTSVQINKAKNFDLYKDGENYVLVDGGQRKITLSYDYNNDPSIVLPISRIIIFSSTHAAFMDRLDVADRIVGATWGESHEWFIESVKTGLKEGRIKDVGISTNPNYDEIVALNPDLVFLTGGTGLWEEHGKKLDELGIPYVVISEWLEDDPLGKFEWIKVFAMLTGTESKASVIFDEVTTKTGVLFDAVAGAEQPEVIWAGIFRGTAYVPRDNSYVGEIISLANADYVFSDIKGTGSAQVSIEELLVRGKDADILVYSSDFIETTEDIVGIHPLLEQLGPIQNCNVYSFQPWYWQSVDKYDDYANDVAAIMHPELFDEYQLKQFKKVSCV